MDIAEVVVGSVDWTRFRISTGEATDFGDRLVALLRSRDATESGDAWRYIENFVFSQNEVFAAAEPTVDVMMAALVEDRPVYVKSLVIDLLFHILNGASAEDQNLAHRCRERAMRGVWLLVREALIGPEWARQAVLEVLDLVDPRQADVLRSWHSS